MNAASQIAAVLKEFGEDWNEGSVWKVQGTPVISHKTLERVAAKAKIRFEPPTVLRAERDEAVLLVVGIRGDQREWSIGECLVNVNYRVSGKQAAYVYAMAEKRAKDRVILKLVQLHGFAYSEEEADEFKGRERTTLQVDADDEPTPQERFVLGCRKIIAEATDAQKLVTWWSSSDQKQQRRDFELSQAQANELREAVINRADALKMRAAA